MANEVLKKDDNTATVAGAVTDDSNQYIRMMRIDDSTKGLKVLLVGGVGAGTVTQVNTAGSVTGGPITGTGTITLVNDNATPGNSYYYGTNASGVKGFYSLTAGSGSVTSVSVVSANGFAGTVATATSTPAITLTTTITGLIKGNGTAISAATAGTDYSAGTSLLATGILKSTASTGVLSIAIAGTDYAPATTGSSILYGNGSGGFSSVTVGSGLNFTSGTLTAAGGTGTVSSVSVVTANGISGTVATATTTPAITLSLGNITPTSVAASGNVTGTNLSGTNTGDQTITLTGDVTGSGAGSFAATIGNNKVTYAKMQAISATSLLLGSSSTATAVQEITLGSGLSMSGSTLISNGGTGMYTVNADETSSTYFNFEAPLIFAQLGTGTIGLAGWNGNNINLVSGGTPSTAYAGGYSRLVPFSGSAWTLSTFLPGSGSSLNFNSAAGKTIRVKTRNLYQGFLSGIFVGYGFTLSTTTNTIQTDQTDITDGTVRFVENNGALYAHVSNGVAATAVNITGSLTLTNWNLYEIVYTPGVSAVFYVNGGIPVATITTNLPTSNTTAIILNMGSAGGSTSSVLVTTHPTISIQN